LPSPNSFTPNPLRSTSPQLEEIKDSPSIPTILSPPILSPSILSPPVLSIPVLSSPTLPPPLPNSNKGWFWSKRGSQEPPSGYTPLPPSNPQSKVFEEKKHLEVERREKDRIVEVGEMEREGEREGQREEGREEKEEVGVEIEGEEEEEGEEENFLVSVESADTADLSEHKDIELGKLCYVS
jgi:hypothetical protein